jgi:hypothetical protein
MPYSQLELLVFRRRSLGWSCLCSWHLRLKQYIFRFRLRVMGFFPQEEGVDVNSEVGEVVSVALDTVSELSHGRA